MSFTVEMNTCCHIKEVSVVGVFQNQEWILRKIGEDLEKQELSDVANESVKFYGHTGEFFPSIYYSSRHQKKKKKITFPKDLESPLCWTETHVYG